MLLLLGLVLLAQSDGIKARDEIADSKNTTSVRFQIQSISSETYTAGNTMCNPGQKCGFHQDTDSSWCVTDYNDNWDYCCTGPCKFEFVEYKAHTRCTSGTEWQYCGNAGDRDIYGRECLLTFPCGMHQEDGKASYYWCYVDLTKNWGKCCNMYNICNQGREGNLWCYTGSVWNEDWQYCVP